MRGFARLSLVLIALTLAAGPALAATNVQPVHTTIGPAKNSASPIRQVIALVGYGIAAFGAIRIKDTATLSKKFVQRATTAAGDYKTGVEAAGQDWHARTAASGDNYANGVQAAIARRGFEKGVNEAGAAKYTQRASTLGASRYPTGVGASEGDWAKGVAPYLDELKGLELPPRRPKGDPGNQARAQAVAARLRARKVGQ